MYPLILSPTLCGKPFIIIYFTGCGGLCALEIEACHLLNAKYFIYTCRPLETLQPCQADEWRCENNFCIPKSKRCDGSINCYDRSDETECCEFKFLALNMYFQNNNFSYFPCIINIMHMIYLSMFLF